MPYHLGMKGGLSLASTLFLLGCSDHVDPANYVASVEHCGGQALTTTVSSRVSLYSPNTSSSDTYVLQICHLDRGCTSVATYKGRVAPIGKLSGNILEFRLPGAQSIDVLRDYTWLGNEKIHIAVTANKEGKESASSNIMLGCRSDREPRPHTEAVPRR